MRTFVFKVLRNGLLTYFTHAQTCDNVRVQSATQWTASVHTLHMPKPVITFVFKVLRNGLLRSPLSGSKVHKDHLLGTGHIAWPGRPHGWCISCCEPFRVLFGGWELSDFFLSECFSQRISSTGLTIYGWKSCIPF